MQHSSSNKTNSDFHKTAAPTRKRRGSAASRRSPRGGVRKGGNSPTSAYEVYRQIPVIKILGKMSKNGDPTSRKMQGKILELSPDTVKAMGNITLNALYDRIPMSAKMKKELEKRSAMAKKLAAPHGSIAQKRKIIQEGGFLPFLAGIIPAVTSLIGSLISSK